MPMPNLRNKVSHSPFSIEDNFNGMEIAFQIQLLFNEKLAGIHLENYGQLSYKNASVYEVVADYTRHHWAIFYFVYRKGDYYPFRLCHHHCNPAKSGSQLSDT